MDARRLIVAIDGKQSPSSFALSASARRTSFSLGGSCTFQASDMILMLIYLPKTHPASFRLEPALRRVPCLPRAIFSVKRRIYLEPSARRGLQSISHRFRHDVPPL